MINELKNISNSIVLSLSAFSNLRDALNNAKNSIKYIRFANEYQKFVYEYERGGYILKGPAKKIENRFKSYELSLFLTTLIQGELEGNILENLEKFLDTLELNYFKYLNRKSSTRLMYVTLGTVLSLIDIALIVMYPIFMQVINNLHVIFS